MEFASGRGKKGCAEMVMVTGILVICRSDVMCLALSGLPCAMIRFGSMGTRPMLDGRDGRGECQRQGDDQTGAKRPDPLSCCRDCLHCRPSGLSPRLLSCLIPPGGLVYDMLEDHAHASHPAIATRLKRAEGHLHRVIGMINEGRPCIDLATQLHAVERAVAEAKRALIHHHIDHCLTGGGAQDLAEIKALTKLL